MPSLAQTDWRVGQVRYERKADVRCQNNRSNSKEPGAALQTKSL